MKSLTIRKLGLAAALLLTTACQPVTTPAPASSGNARTLVIYSGRNENLVGPLVEQFEKQSGIDAEVRYGGTAEMAATILEEGDNSPADLFFGQDAGALGALAKAGRCSALPASVTEAVDPRFVGPTGKWVGVSGRARVLVYNTEMVGEEELPQSVFDLTAPKWRGRVGWAPTNASFQSFVTAMRATVGEEATRRWLEEMVANDVQVYDDNTPLVEAVGRGEVAAGLTNHYYLLRFLSEDPDFPAADYYFPSGDASSMINAAGACILNTAEHPEEALRFVEFLVSDAAQQYFAQETFEYPLSRSSAITIDERLQPLNTISLPTLDLSDLDDLPGTLQLLQEVGALP